MTQFSRNRVKKIKVKVKEYALAFQTIVLILLILVGCQENRKYNWLVDNQGYNYAIIQLADGNVVEGKIEYWTDFQDGDQIEVKINGTIYLIHSANCTLIYKQ